MRSPRTSANSKANPNEKPRQRKKHASTRSSARPGDDTRGQETHGQGCGKAHDETPRRTATDAQIRAARAADSPKAVAYAAYRSAIVCRAGAGVAGRQGAGGGALDPRDQIRRLSHPGAARAR